MKHLAIFMKINDVFGVEAEKRREEKRREEKRRRENLSKHPSARESGRSSRFTTVLYNKVSPACRQVRAAFFWLASLLALYKGRRSGKGCLMILNPEQKPKGKGFLFSFAGKYIQFADWSYQYMKNIFFKRIVTFLRGKIFSSRGLLLSSGEKHFPHEDCHFPQGKNIFFKKIVTFLKGKTFSSRGLLLSSREKYFPHEDCLFPQGKNIFFKGIVTFLLRIVTFLLRNGTILSWSGKCTY